MRGAGRAARRNGPGLTLDRKTRTATPKPVQTDGATGACVSSVTGLHFTLPDIQTV